MTNLPGSGAKQRGVRADAPWTEVTEAGTIHHAGNSQLFETGDWRSIRPIHNPEKCINCFLCWMSCPDMAVKHENGKVIGFDYHHCKGCGVCERVCPPKVHAIEMVPEPETDKEEAAVEGGK